MASVDINRVMITGNLTRDPELRALPGGTAVCSLRVAVNTRRKDGSGQWVDKPNYFDVTVFGASGENCSRFLSRGKPVAVDGRLEWREWETKGGDKRQSVEIVADSVKFLPSRDGGQAPAAQSAYGSDQPAPGSQYAGAPAAAGTYGQPKADDDVPF